jgi:ribosomal protein S18 acetylase RimI-like enzyme
LEVVSGQFIIRRAMPIDVDGAVMLDPQGHRALIEASLAAGNGWVAQRNGGILAFAVVTDHFYGRPFIDLLVVREQSRRVGIGRALVSYIVREHRGARVFTSTNESNTPMRRLLEGMDSQPRARSTALIPTTRSLCSTSTAPGRNQHRP